MPIGKAKATTSYIDKQGNYHSSEAGMKAANFKAASLLAKQRQQAAASGWKKKTIAPSSLAPLPKTPVAVGAGGSISGYAALIRLANPKKKPTDKVAKPMSLNAAMVAGLAPKPKPKHPSVQWPPAKPASGQSLRATHGGWVKGKTCVNKLSKNGPTSNKCRVGVSKANPAKGARQHPQGDGYMRKKPVKKK